MTEPWNVYDKERMKIRDISLHTGNRCLNETHEDKGFANTVHLVCGKRGILLNIFSVC